MAAKTTTTSDPGFASAIARVEPALAGWRQRRKHREPIPETIWARMIPVARRYGLSLVARTLRVNYNGLKRHLLVSSVPSGRSQDPAASAFVEVPVNPWPSSESVGGWIMELEERGCKLTVRLPTSEQDAALALAQGLWRQRR